MSLTTSVFVMFVILGLGLGLLRPFLFSREHRRVGIEEGESGVGGVASKTLIPRT